jgi:hypothetical protein
LDRSGSANATVDGALVIRAQLGLNGEALMAELNPLHTSAIFVRDVYERERDAIDVDGDGVISISDTLMVTRWLLGYDGNRLVEGLTLNAPRNNAPLVAAHLALMCPR